MTDRKQQIMMLIAKQPRIRDVEIADTLDMDMDQVHRDLSDAVASNEVWVEKITAPNGLKVNAYSINPTSSGWSSGWKAHSVAAPASQPSAVPIPVAPVVSPAVKELTKVDKAIAYLTANGSVTPRDLAIAMGLDVRKQSPSQYLGHCIRTGRIVKDGKLFRLGVEGGVAAAETLSPAQKERLSDQQARDFSKSSAPAAALIDKHIPALAPAHDDVHTPSHYTAGGMEVIDILRAKLSLEEFRGFCKGNVIKYTLRAELKGGVKDYAKANVYSGWLVSAVNDGAAHV
jgi:hypothetical protein